MKSEVKGLYRVTMLVYKRADISEEQFHNHWTNVHPSKVQDWLAKYGVVTYRQYHTPSWVREQAQEKLKTFGSFASEQVVDYDGFVELLMPDLSCFENARKDQYYEEVVKPDEESFFDQGRSHMTVGWEELYVDDSKVVDSGAISSDTTSK